MVEIRCIVDAKNHLGEGPLWDVKEQRLYWIDSSAAEIYSAKEDGSDIKRYFVPTHIGSMALREKAAPCWRWRTASASMISRPRS